MIAAMNMLTAAWIPFVQPLPLHEYWMFLLVPLTLVIALVYKTLKLENLSKLIPETIKLTVTILLFMVAAAAVLWFLTEQL